MKMLLDGSKEYDAAALLQQKSHSEDSANYAHYYPQPQKA
jgi:hypothetical protein